MNQFLQYLSNNVQLVVFLVIILFSALGQLGKTLNNVKQKRRIEQERQRRIQESMRTGRPVPDPAQEQASEIEARRQRLAEMQQRRQAQLEELRRRRQEMLQRQGGAPTGTPGTPQTQAQVPVPLNPQPQTRPAPINRPRPTTRPTSRPRPVPSTGHAGSHTVREASTLSSPAAAPHGTIHVSEDLGTLGGHKLDTEIHGAGVQPFQHTLLDVQPAAATGLAKHGIQLRGREDLRRAIILAEILERPVALRPDRLQAFE